MGKIAVAAIVSLWVIPMTILVNHIVPGPYMDEIFHIPQAQQYCKGNFGTWDPMITTPPGLCYLSLAHVASLFPGVYFVCAASSFSDMCSTAILRSTNAILAVICSIIINEIITHLKPKLDDKKVTIHVVVLTLYPLHWFFNFLYYADVASVTAVLAMYLACLKKNYWLSALTGAFTVVIQQTNIIWVLFVACAGITDISLTHKYNNNARTTELDVSISKPGVMYATTTNMLDLNLRKQKSNKNVDIVKSSLPSKHLSSPPPSDDIWAIILTLWQKKWELLVSFSPLLMVLIAFLLFVCSNGSVVLGAKEAHAVSPHFAQMLYFGLVSVLAMAPMHFTVTQVSELFQLFWKNRLFGFFQEPLVHTAGVLSVHFFSVAHPYLLADNRRYPFYLWRKVILAHWSMKYLLVLVYIYSGLSIIHMLGQYRLKTLIEPCLFQLLVGETMTILF